MTDTKKTTKNEEEKVILEAEVPIDRKNFQKISGKY
jgi:hypothetical protein